MNPFRDLIRAALWETVTYLQLVIDFLTPDDPTPLSVLQPTESDICEDCDGICGVCQALGREARYYAPPASGFDGGSVYHARADRE